MDRSVTRRGLFRAIALRLARPTSDSPLVKRWTRHWCAVHHVNTGYGPCVYCQQHEASLQEKEPIEGAREKAKRRTQETPVVQPPPPTSAPAPLPDWLRDFALTTGPLLVMQRPAWMNDVLDLRASGDLKAINPLTQFEQDAWINSPSETPDPEDTKEAPAIMRLKYCEHPQQKGNST